MTIVHRQVHGYRQGHQLIAAAVQLPKADQSVIDRLSDVAGPLRPRESFEPYITAYPLPSGERYVLAKTWQDSTVARAGCVRTLSLIIPTVDWADAKSLSPFLDLLEADGLPRDEDATSNTVSASGYVALPPAPEFRAGELLEALFLEEPRPVVVFDAPSPEIIAVRLLTALWPSMRRKFALSTFALSPRKVSGRDFDLVFSPKDARSKFSDWDGRRVDGRSSQDARHRWTGAIVSRVFEQPRPQLLSSNEIGLVGGDDGADNAVALRIALLWDELLGKMKKIPTAALGLLDIANSGKVRDSVALRSLEPALMEAIRHAPLILPESEAWDFLGALARKVQKRSMAEARGAIAETAEKMAGRAPEGALALLARPVSKDIFADLLPRIADGIGNAFTDRAEQALLDASPEVLGRLIAEGGLLTQQIASDGPLIERLGIFLAHFEPILLDAISSSLLPHLVEDWQLPAVEPLVARLDPAGLAEEVCHLGIVNDFGSLKFAELLLKRAREIGAEANVRTALVSLPPSDRRNALLARTLDPSIPDIAWVLGASELSPVVTSKLVTHILRDANDRQISEVVGDERICSNVLRSIESEDSDLLQRIVFLEGLPTNVFVGLVTTVLPKADAATKVRIAETALRHCLSTYFDSDALGFLGQMLGLMGNRLDGAWAARTALDRKVDPAIASRNMVAFRNAPQAARLRIIECIAEVAQILRGRLSFDLDAPAIEACAYILSEAEKVIPAAALNASGRLLPMMMRARKRPVSSIIAVAFPQIYRELAKAKEVPDLLKLVPFFDWDRCKAARHELVSAFMSTSWAPGDLALTAYRMGEIDKVLQRTVKQYGGEAYIKRLAADLERCPEACRRDVERSIAALKLD